MDNPICPRCSNPLQRWWVTKAKYGLRAGYCSTCKRMVTLASEKEGSKEKIAEPSEAAISRRAGKTHGHGSKRKPASAARPGRGSERGPVPAQRNVPAPTGSRFIRGLKSFFDL